MLFAIIFFHISFLDCVVIISYDLRFVNTLFQIFFKFINQNIHTVSNRSLCACSMVMSPGMMPNKDFAMSTLSW